MFKAPIKVASHNAISNKDRKTLKKDLTKNFPTDVIDMIFINSSDISATKLTGSPIVIYSDEEAPLFIDSTANADFFPTIYGVDLYPDIVRSLYLKEGVEAFILKGANLMWPGVDKISEITGDMNQDDVVAIRRAGNNEVVAIGALACDPESVKNSEKPDGIACYILHIEGDSLWGAGAKAHLKPKWDRKIQEQKEQEQLAKLQKKEKKKQEADEEEEDENESNLLGFINKREHTAVDMSKGKVKQLPKDLKTGGTESKASKGTAPAKGGKDKDEKGKGKDKDDEKKGKVAKGKDDKGKGKDKDDDKKGKGGKKDDKKGGDKKKDDKKDKKKDDKKDNKKKQESESEGEEEEDNDEEEGEEDEEVEEMTEKKGKVETEATTVTQEGEDEDSDEDWKTGGKGKGAKKAPAKGNAKESTKDKDEDGVSKEDMKKMDEEIMAAFLNACKISITDKDLPIELGKLWTNFIVKCRTDPNEELDFKLSSYKKIGKFIQHLQKEKLLTYEEASKKNPVPKVTKIELHHKKVLDWAPTVSARDLDDRDKENEKDDQKENSWRVQVEITKLYKPNDSVKVFLDGAAGPMTKVEAEKKFSTWLKSNNLIEKDSVIYNDQLFNKCMFRT